MSDTSEVTIARKGDDSKSSSTTQTGGWPGWPVDAPKPAIAPFDDAQAKNHHEEWAANLEVPVEYTNSIGMKFRLIPPGGFLRGSTSEEIARAQVHRREYGVAGIRQERRTAAQGRADTANIHWRSQSAAEGLRNGDGIQSIALQQ